MGLEAVVFVGMRVGIALSKIEMVDLIRLHQHLMVGQLLQGMYPLASQMRMLKALYAGVKILFCQWLTDPLG